MSEQSIDWDDPRTQSALDWYVAGQRSHNPFSSDWTLSKPFRKWLIEYTDEVRREAAAEQREKDARMARDVADKLANGGLIEHGDGAYDAAAAIREAGINKEEGTK